MTLDELIKTAREAKKAGIPGDTQVLVPTGKAWDDDYQVRTTNYLESVTVRLEESSGPKNRTQVQYGNIVDGRGRPKGTVRAVRLI